MGAALILADRAFAPAERHGAVAAVLLFALVFGGAAIYWGRRASLGATEPRELARIARRKRS